MNYFDLFPNVQLPSFSDKRNSSNDFILLKICSKEQRFVMIFLVTTAFSKYTVEGDDRPDNVAHKIYENESLDWVVLLSNNIINVRNEWPMGQRDFQKYLDNKYDPTQLSQVHHYETKEIRDMGGNIYIAKGLVVDSDFTYSHTTNGVRRDVNDVISVSYLDLEIKKNDDKRVINLLRSEYVGTIIDDMRQIMTYTDSSQFVNRKLKKADNLRIISPR